MKRSRRPNVISQRVTHGAGAINAHPVTIPSKAHARTSPAHIVRDARPSLRYPKQRSHAISARVEQRPQQIALRKGPRPRPAAQRGQPRVRPLAQLAAARPRPVSRVEQHSQPPPHSAGRSQSRPVSAPARRAGERARARQAAIIEPPLGYRTQPTLVELPAAISLDLGRDPIPTLQIRLKHRH